MGFKQIEDLPQKKTRSHKMVQVSGEGAPPQPPILLRFSPPGSATQPRHTTFSASLAPSRLKFLNITKVLYDNGAVKDCSDLYIYLFIY